MIATTGASVVCLYNALDMSADEDSSVVDLCGHVHAHMIARAPTVVGRDCAFWRRFRAAAPGAAIDVEYLALDVRVVFARVCR